MIKGFIEVTDEYGYSVLINIKNIEVISENRIYLIDDELKFQETYEEIKEKIREALG